MQNNSTKRNTDGRLAMVIDAGGSKTRAVLCRVRNEAVPQPLASVTLGPGNVTSEGFERVAGLVKEIQAFLGIHSAEEPPFILAGFAGASAASTLQRVREYFKHEGLERGGLHITSDAHLILDAVGSEGIGLILGTGSMCLGRSNGIEARAGGRGWLIGSDGSGFWFGQQALRAAFRSYDGLGEKTSLEAVMAAHWGAGSLPEIVSIAHRQPIDRARFAATAPVVFQHALNGDAVSNAIVESGAHAIAELIHCVHLKLGSPPITVGLCGGIVSDERFEKLVMPHIKAALNVKISALNFRLFTATQPDSDHCLAALRHALQSAGSIEAD